MDGSKYAEPCDGPPAPRTIERVVTAAILSPSTLRCESAANFDPSVIGL
jgi:hypothetical protein